LSRSLTFGNVNSKSVRRPNVSIVQMAGHANTKLTRPKPQDTSNALVTLAPAFWKIVAL
jgi:hypothetical protein